MHRTVKALLARSFPHELAESLWRQGCTLGELQQASHEKLNSLGIGGDLIAGLAKGRPPIPDDTLYAVLYECRWTCCRCRNSAKSVVVHHINPWSESRNHGAENLVVLCNDCHNEAHTNRELAQNFTPDAIRDNKRRWLETVSEEDTKSLFRAPSWDIGHSVWDYFNHRRLTEAAEKLNVDCTQCHEFFELQQQNRIDSTGSVVWSDEEYSRRSQSWFIYDGVMRLSTPLYRFHSDLLKQVVSNANWIDMRRIWSRSEIESMVRPGRLLALTGRLSFRRDNSQTSGPGQIRTGRYRSRGIELKFTVDAWEATSTSAIDHLSGWWVSTCICIARSVSQDSGVLRIEATCLGIGTGFTDYLGETPAVALKHEQCEEEEWDESTYADDSQCF